MKKVYAVYDTIGIQSYIFASNKLRENKGASELAGRVLKEYLPNILKETLKDAYDAGNVIVDWKNRRDEPLKIASAADVKAEIVYIGGGNAYVVYDTYETYADITKAFMLDVYEKAAGIGIATASICTDFSGNYTAEYAQLHANLAVVKSKLNRPIPASNQPITKASPLTGLPAVEISDSGEFLSIDQVQKRAARNSTRDREKGEKFLEFSELNRGTDFISVIHADGNSMAKLIEKYADTPDWHEAVPRIREMSYRISTLYKTALENTVKNFESFYNNEVSKSKNSKSEMDATLPFINIIADGDDITCVIAGQYGLSFAANLLREVERLNNSDAYPFPDWEKVWPAKPLATACAGAVIFHSHYPFSAAYEMAEACCANAKRYTRKADVVGSFIDFHLHSAGTVASLNQFRKEQYSVHNGASEESLLYRPYCVSVGECFDDIYPPFSQFELLMDEWVFQNNAQATKPWPRSRQKALRNALSKSAAEVDDVINWCKARGFALPSHPPLVKSKGGQQALSDYALLFDVLELADMYKKIPNLEECANADDVKN